MSLRNINIADGVRLHYLPLDKFKTNFMSVSFLAPLEPGTSAMNSLIPNILLRGSEKYPDMAEINKRLDHLYASGISTRCSKRGDVQVFELCADMLDSSYAIGGEDITSEMVGILAELIFHPVTVNGVFDPDYVESEKQNQIDAISGVVNNPAVFAYRRLIGAMCENERYRLTETGTIEETAACTPDGLYEHYTYALRHYPVEIFFVGRCDEKKLAASLSELFSYPREPIKLPETEFIRAAETVKQVSEDMPVSQGKLVIGMRSGVGLYDREYPAAVMFNAVLGGTFTSKLFTNVREKMSLCYYCQSAFDAPKGLIIVQSGIEVDKKEIAETAIFEQLEAMKRGDFTGEELNSALLALIGGYSELSDSARGLEGWYLGRVVSGLDDDPDGMVERLKAVTRDEIIAAANRVTPDTVYFLRGTLEGGEDEYDE